MTTTTLAARCLLRATSLSALLLVLAGCSGSRRCPMSTACFSRRPAAGIAIATASSPAMSGKPTPPSCSTVPTATATTASTAPSTSSSSPPTACSRRSSSATTTPTATAKSTRTEFVDKPNRAFALLDKSNECKLTSNQIAGARAHTEQVFDSKKPESGDPREKQDAGHALMPTCPLFSPRYRSTGQLAKLRPLAVPSFLDTTRRSAGELPTATPALGAQ